MKADDARCWRSVRQLQQQVITSSRAECRSTSWCCRNFNFLSVLRQRTWRSRDFLDDVIVVIQHTFVMLSSCVVFVGICCCRLKVTYAKTHIQLYKWMTLHSWTRGLTIHRCCINSFHREFTCTSYGNWYRLDCFREHCSYTWVLSCFVLSFQPSAFWVSARLGFFTKKVKVR